MQRSLVIVGLILGVTFISSVWPVSQAAADTLILGGGGTVSAPAPSVNQARTRIGFTREDATAGGGTSSGAICDHAAPPAGCDYVGGDANGCGMTLSCSGGGPGGPLH